MRANLSDRLLRGIKPKAGHREEIWDEAFRFDAGIPGSFGIRVSEKGRISFQIMFRLAIPGSAAKLIRLALGQYPAMSLAVARQRAREVLLTAAKGVDPRQMELSVPVSTPGTVTVSDAVADFIARYAKPKNRSWRETQRIFNRYVLPAIGSMPIKEVQRSDVRKILDKLMDDGSGPTANRTLAAIRKFSNWCFEREIVSVNFCQGISPPAREKARSRVLSLQEIVEVWLATYQLGWPFGNFVRLLILTGQRRDEVAGLRWQDIDESRQAWTIPSDANKSGRDHEVPLTALALTEISSLPRLGSMYVFTTTGATYISGFSKAKASLDRLIFDRQAGQQKRTSVSSHDNQLLSPWTFHDIRRSVATHMAQLNVEPWVIESVLNHSSGFKGGVAGVYNRHNYNAQKLAAFEKWHEMLLTALAEAGQPSTDAPIAPEFDGDQQDSNLWLSKGGNRAFGHKIPEKFIANPNQYTFAIISSVMLAPNNPSLQEALLERFRVSQVHNLLSTGASVPREIVLNRLTASDGMRSNNEFLVDMLEGFEAGILAADIVQASIKGLAIDKAMTAAREKRKWGSGAGRTRQHKLWALSMPTAHFWQAFSQLRSRGISGSEPSNKIPDDRWFEIDGDGILQIFSRPFPCPPSKQRRFLELAGQNYTKLVNLSRRPNRMPGPLLLPDQAWWFTTEDGNPFFLKGNGP